MVCANNVSKKWLAWCQHHYPVIILTIKNCRCAPVHTVWNTEELRMIKVHLIGFWHNLISGESGGEGAVGSAPFYISLLYSQQCWFICVDNGASGENGLSGTKSIILWKWCFIKWEVFPQNVIFWKVCMLVTVLLPKCPNIIVNGNQWGVLINVGSLDIFTPLTFVSSSKCLGDFSARTLRFSRPCFLPCFKLLEIACTTV